MLSNTSPWIIWICFYEIEEILKLNWPMEGFRWLITYSFFLKINWTWYLTTCISKLNQFKAELYCNWSKECLYFTKLHVLHYSADMIYYMATDRRSNKNCIYLINHDQLWSACLSDELLYSLRSYNLRTPLFTFLLKLKHFSHVCFKRDKELEAQALDWIEANLGEPVDRKTPYEDVLRDGIILCK